MSEEKRYEVAKKYVDKQLKAKKRFGPDRKRISAQEYKTLIKQVAQAVQK
jgi:hypothetical protein